MLTDKQLDEILCRIDGEKERETYIRCVKAQAEIEAINRERTAYYDGAYDAIKAVKAALEARKGAEHD